MTDTELRLIIEKVLAETGKTVASAPASASAVTSEGILPDITEIDLRKDFHVANPKNVDAYMKLKATTPARIGVGRAGTRFRTDTLIRFRADHAAAMDAVWNDVPDGFFEDIGAFQVQTKVENKDEFITRPDLGRLIDDEGVAAIKANCASKPKVQIFIADGLSSTAVETNGKDTFLSIQQGLKAYGIECNKPFFVKYGRVGSSDHVAEILDAEVTVVLLGERPGLVTSESMSSYMTYKGYVGIPEAKRTVISNIHSQGTPAAEAGAHIAEIIKKMLEQKASGLDLKL